MTSVVGIDLGAAGSRIGVARNRGIDVILNEASSRSTPSMVGFAANRRWLGEAAATTMTSNAKNTIGSLRRLIGRTFSDPEIAEIESRYLSADMVDVQGQIGFKVNYLGEPTTFTVTQLYAMLLGRLRDTAAAEVKAVNDVVIAIPGWYTDPQRRAVLDAAEIAGLNVLRLVHDTTATALGYGITRADLPEQSEKPKTVVFCDIGHSDFSVAVVEFSKGRLAVKATAYDRNFGGRDLDYALAQHFADEFKEKYKIDVRSNRKAMFRLLVAVEKLKKILSANAMAPLSVESIMEDIDASSSLTREALEELIAPLLDRTTVPLQTALKQAGITAEDVDSIELVGGSSRVPGIRSRIQAFFNKPLSTTTNADEAIARGATFVCATLSPVFRVRDFEIADIVAYPIEISWDRAPEDESNEETTLLMFPPSNPQPQAKLVKLQRSEPFDLEARYASSATLPGSSNRWIARCTVKNVRRSADGRAPDIKVRARVDANGIFSFDPTATLSEYADAPAEAESAVEPETAPVGGEGEAAAAAATVAPKRKVIKTELPVVVGTSSLERSTLEDYRSREGEMAATDKLVSETEATKNELEEHIYAIREKLDSSWSAYASDADKGKARAAADDAETWLYSEEGEDSTKSVYAERLKALHALSDPIAFRKRESEGLPSAARGLREVLQRFTTQLNDDKHTHLSEDDREKVVSAIANAEHWLNDSVARQAERPKDNDPRITQADITKRLDEVTYTVQPILSKAPPKPKTEAPKPKQDDVPAKPEPTASEPADAAMDVDEPAQTATSVDEID